MSSYTIRLRGRVADLAGEVLISDADSAWRAKYDIVKTKRVLIALVRRIALGGYRAQLELNFQPVADLRPIYDELTALPPSERVAVRWGLPEPKLPQR